MVVTIHTPYIKVATISLSKTQKLPIGNAVTISGLRAVAETNKYMNGRTIKFVNLVVRPHISLAFINRRTTQFLASHRTTASEPSGETSLQSRAPMSGTLSQHGIQEENSFSGRA